MAFVFANPNPKHNLVGDCTIRALSIAAGKDWEKVFAELSLYGFMSCDMPSSNAVWGQYLTDLGYKRSIVQDSCPACTVRDFAARNPHGKYILGTGSHVVCVVDGDYYDTWDSGDERPIFVWEGKSDG